MQTSSDATVDRKLAIADRNFQIKGKENRITSSACLQPTKLQHTSENPVAHGLQKSRLPVPCKAKAPPDFQKMHQTWQSHFQKGKAVCKKTCTRPQPFNFSQRGERSRAQSTDLKISGASSTEKPSSNAPAACKSRDPLSDVVLVQNKKESSVVQGASEMDFKSDPVALASILSNIGVSAAPVGKVSLARRVPMRAFSTAHPLNSTKNSMIRSSLYTVPSSYTGPANLDRMSCFSKMTIKANEQKPLFGSLNNPISESIVQEPEGLKKEERCIQENPVLQQMNPPNHVPMSEKTSCSRNPQEDILTRSLLTKTDKASSVLPTQHCENSSTELDVSAQKKDSIKKEGTISVDFVADPLALASIITNTEMNNINCGKLSLAQRVPVQGKSSMYKGGMALPGTKPACAPVSNVAMPIKDVMFSPFRVPLVTGDKSSGGSARRVIQPQSSALKFSYCATPKQPVFPKTPRALALEKANMCLEADKMGVQISTKSTVKWADELSPSPLSEVLCEHERDIEDVATRLFLDGEGPGDLEKKTEPSTVSDPQKILESPSRTTQLDQPDASGAHVGDAQSLQFHSQMHHAPLPHPASRDPPSSVVSCIKPSVPLSFLSHPAVQALQFSSLGPHSLPDIARLRLQAAVSAKQRFWEARLDEECAFYTSRGTSGSTRSCKNPVSLLLEKQEDMHFTPISFEES